MLHRKVQCWIFSQNNEQCLLLLTNRARGEFWQPVTGTVEAGEGFFEAACRESFEETGFKFKTAPLDTVFEFDFTSRFGPTRERIFALTIDDLPEPRLDSREHQAFQWLPPLAALKLLRFPSNIDGLKKTYALVFGKELLA